MIKNPVTGNTFRFDWMMSCKWTVKEIKGSFNLTSSAIARHIQSVFPTEAQAWEIVKAHKELTIDQIGF